MGGFVGVIVCVAGAAMLYETGHPVLFWLAVSVSIVSIWTLGIMHNYALNSARIRNEMLASNMAHDGRSKEDVEKVKDRIIRLGPRDLDTVPNGLAMVDMLATIVGFILFISGAVVRLF